MKTYRILALDGGGIRGALTVNLLARLIKAFPPLITNTDLLAGTSTGSFIALGLANNQPIKELVNLYTIKNIKSVFEPDYINLIRPRYDRKGLKTLLQTVFSPSLKLKQLNTRIIVPAFRMVGPENWNTILFNNFPNSSTQNKTVLTAALASSAAPTYFPSYQQYIDGGVTINNPSLAAVGLARDNLSFSLNDIYLLSIGTGIKPNEIKSTKNWGILQWAINPTPPPQLPLLNVLIEGGKETTAKLSQQLLGEQYFRLNPPLPSCISLDEYQQIPQLIELANQYNLKPAVNWLTANWQ